MILLFSVTAESGPGKPKRLLGQAVKTSPFHGGNTGSIPVGVIAFNAYCISWMHTIDYGDLAKW